MNKTNTDNIPMRIPTNPEWDKLVDVTEGNNDIIHWKRMYSWTSGRDYKVPSWTRTTRGFFWDNDWNYFNTGWSDEVLGFRPAVELSPDMESSDIKDGDLVTIGTLYMHGIPVKVPENPMWVGDVLDYLPLSRLEMKTALDDPAYQVKGIKVGNAVIADRCLLKNLSFKDIEIGITE